MRAGATVVWLLAMVSGVAAGERPATECPAMASIVSQQGTVEIRRAGDDGWAAVALDERCCAGDTVRTGPRSRAGLALEGGGVLRLDELTTVTFPASPRPRGTWFEILRGVVHVLSRVPRGLEASTPFLNASVEGTEFAIAVDDRETAVTVFAGRLRAGNASGSVVVESRHVVVAMADGPPTIRPVVITPADAVSWALYYPPVLELAEADFPDRPGLSWPSSVRASIRQASAGKLVEAFEALAQVPPDLAEPSVLAYRAGLLLAVGRVAEAEADIARLLQAPSGDAVALGLRAVVALAQGRTGEAATLADRAVDVDPHSPVAHLARSYARQAGLDLHGALDSATVAAALRPEAGLAQARVAELQLAFREIDAALEHARGVRGAVAGLARAETVTGFAHLAAGEAGAALAAFDRAVVLDTADPQPRLGRGLAMIRRGRLAAGRRELEIAIGLDPGNAITRSYLGRAFYEERNDAKALEQFAAARTLDPRDPTPWLYQAIQRHSVNRPVEALRDLEQAVALNDHRAVYRSRFLLDQDLATRSSHLGRIYDTLGFQQRALVEGWASLAIDPASYAAHRLLADAYLALPRHDVARVSEVLQSQLLQPVDGSPLQPALAQRRLLADVRLGPMEPAFNEYDAVFTRDGFTVLGTALGGGDATAGDQVILAGVRDGWSFSLGQLFYTTDGVRTNADTRQALYNAFVQYTPSWRSSVQAEFRSDEVTEGDPRLRFDPRAFDPRLRQRLETRLGRIGLRYAFAPGSTLLASVVCEWREGGSRSPGRYRTVAEDDRCTGEGQHLWQAGAVRVVSGVSHGRNDGAIVALTGNRRFVLDEDGRRAAAYVYASGTWARALTLTLGATANRVDSPAGDRRGFDPKAGLVWVLPTGTILRTAVFRTLAGTNAGDQSIEPTQVAGFNQRFDDPKGTSAWRWGWGADQLFGQHVLAGAEYSERRLSVPFVTVTPRGSRRGEAEWDERFLRAYVGWLLHPRWVFGIDYQYERLDRGPSAPGPELLLRSTTHRLPLRLEAFHPNGLFAGLRGTFVHQDGIFLDARGLSSAGRDAFWVFDASLGYRLPKRRGVVSLEGANLLDTGFRYQDTDPARPTIAPGRRLLVRLTLAF